MEFRAFLQHYEVLLYLFTVVCFVFGLKMLTSPKTARKGNLLSAVGMLVAIATALLSSGVVDYTTVALVFGIGSVVGAILAGILVGVAQSLTTIWFPQAAQVVIYVLMGLTIILRPQGLFGKR